MSDIGPRCLADLALGSDRCGNRFLLNDNDDDVGPPEWLDRARFDRGRRFFFDFFNSCTWAFFCSLIVGFALPSLSDVFEFTGETEGPLKSRKRYLQTLAHLISWHRDDIFDPATIGYRSIRTVRSWHDSIRRRLEGKFGTDRVFISQYDMALVQCGFIGSVVLHPTDVGIPSSGVELDDYVYFWKVAGYVLGIEDRFNVCQSEDVQLVVAICAEVERSLIAPRIGRPSSQQQRLTDDLLTGYAEVGPPLPLSARLMHAFIFPSIGLTSPPLTWAEWLTWIGMRIHYTLILYFPAYRASSNRQCEHLFRNLKPVCKVYQ